MTEPSTPPDVETFGRLFRDFLDRVVSHTPGRESPLAGRLRDHLGADLREVPVSGARFSPFEHPDVQVALEGYLAGHGRTAQVTGVSGGGMSGVDLLVHGQPGPVRHVEVPVDVDRRMSCISSGVLLVDDPHRHPHAIVVHLQEHGPVGDLEVEVLSPDPQHASDVLAELRQRMTDGSVYRGKVFALTSPQGPFGRNVGAEFLPRPSVERADIVLPQGRLDVVERRTLGAEAAAAHLRAQGQHRRRGLLLYGPPGTGKTLTARYLIGRMPHRTVVVLTGTALGAVSHSAALARRLEPSLLLLEDVDLVAHDRTLGPQGNPLLFELLNQLDGLGEDADVLVVLTTNRAELLEPALAARPGRVDLAVEFPLPDAGARRRLFELFTRGVDCTVQDWSTAVERSDGTPASFVREVVRTAVLLSASAEGGDDAGAGGAAGDAAAGDSRAGGAVTDGHVEQALAELLDSGPLTPALLGARPDDVERWPRGVPLPPGAARAVTFLGDG